MAVSVIVFVEDVARALGFYERVAGAEVDHFDKDGSYGELTSGVGFAAHDHVEHHLDLSFHRNEPGGLPSGFELEFAVDDVDSAFARAIDAGATAVLGAPREALGPLDALTRPRRRVRPSDSGLGTQDRSARAGEEAGLDEQGH
jgi:catechol 2,3-dioxygenase-like lactoylglutathione lyase family enzyme